MFCIISGNPVEGYTVTGPFESARQAQLFAQDAQLSLDQTDWIVPMCDPAQEFGSTNDD